MADTRYCPFGCGVIMTPTTSNNVTIYTCHTCGYQEHNQVLGNTAIETDTTVLKTTL
jgi:DNA-directed RNA polymerase subunit M/transcription elongation factor TFIIS